MSLADADEDPDGRRAAGADPAKRRKILEGARQVFMSLGFDGASMGDIARAASVSKGTLYVYFDSKEALFSAFVAEERRDAKWDLNLDPADPDIAAALGRYGRTLLDHVTRPRNIDSVRTIIAIAGRFPRIGLEFYRDGPKRGLDYISAYLAAQSASGRLRIDEPVRASEQLRALFQAGILNELLFGVRSPPDEAEIARAVEEAVTTFLARYAA